MIKSLLLSTLLSITLFSQETVATYDVEHTFLGKIAQADIVKEYDDVTYTAELLITTTGIASTLSNHLEKRFISQGSLKEGLFYPDVLAVIQKRDDEEKYIIYRFNHDKEILHVDKYALIQKVKTHFNPMNFEFDEEHYSEFTFSSHHSHSYVKDDVISLFFNAKTYMQNNQDVEQMSFMAAGIYDEEEDALDGILAFGISQKDIHDMIQTSISNSMLSVALSDKVFHDSDKYLYIDLHEDSLPQRVKLNDIAFGDVMIERIFDNVASVR